MKLPTALRHTSLLEIGRTTMIWCVALPLAVSACSSADVAAPVGASVQGVWTGHVEGPEETPLHFTLVDAGDGDVTGTVELGDLLADVAGTFDDPDLRLDVELMLTLNDSLWFEGRLVQRDSLRGMSHSRIVVTYTDPGGIVREEISRDSSAFVAARQ